MKQPEYQPAKTNRAIWRILCIVLIASIVILVALTTYLPSVQTWLGDPGAIFAGDDTLQDSARMLASAEERLRSRPDDDSAHLDRAKAYMAFGHLEGARLEWENQNENGSAEWGDIARSLDELELKTSEIRALLHDAENSPSPSDQYPPIYTLLDDIALRFEGIPRYRALFLKGYLLLREGRRAEAEPIFGEGLKYYVPIQDYVLYNHARSLMVTDAEDDALEEFENFLNEFPFSRLAPLANLERINLLRDLGRSDEAIRECMRVLDNYPTSPFAPKALRKWAEVIESEMNFDDGADIRVRIIREYPDSPEASSTTDMFFGGVYSPSLLSVSDTAAVAFSAVDSHTSDAFEILSELAESEDLTSEERAMACHGAARCEYSLGRYYECIDWAERAISLAPGTEWADRSGIRIGHAYWRLEKYPLAKDAYWNVARGRGPVASVACEILWKKAYADSDLETTADACRYIVDEYPGSDETPAAMTMLAYLACRDSQYQTANGYATRCLSAFPDSPSGAEAGFWFARSLDGLGRSVEANGAYEDLARRVPWNYWGIRAREHLGINDGSFLIGNAADPFDFSTERVSMYSGSLATAFELYDAGVMELAESEFLLARENGIPGAWAGLSLVYAEQGEIHSGVVTIRDAAAVGDQASLTPARMEKMLDELYPRPFEEDVRAASLAHDIPPAWLWGTMRQESCFNQHARSPSGACGLIQIMPQTGRFIASQRGAETFDPETLWDTSLNLDYGAWYFSYLRREIGGDRLTYILAAYNGGPGRLRTYRNELPTRDDDIFLNAIPNDETRNFAHWVYANIRMYESILKAEGYQMVPF